MSFAHWLRGAREAFLLLEEEGLSRERKLVVCRVRFARVSCPQLRFVDVSRLPPVSFYRYRTVPVQYRYCAGTYWSLKKGERSRLFRVPLPEVRRSDANANAPTHTS